MATPAMALDPTTCSITVNVYDGSRQPLSGVDVLFTLIDGSQKRTSYTAKTGQLVVNGLPWFKNFEDTYSVVASASGYNQAGSFPVNVSPRFSQKVDLMLLAKDASFNFNGTWEAIRKKRPTLARLLTAGAGTVEQGRQRFQDAIDTKTEAIACLLNVATGMEQIHLGTGSPLDRFQELIWDDSMARDRFYGWAKAELLDEVKQAAHQDDPIFSPEPLSGLFHKGATCSFKQNEFGEANVQLSFHENDTHTIRGVKCVKVECDIDYYKDQAAHTILEVIVNKLTHTLTDPRDVYVLRWIAGRRAGVPEFDPLYTIA